MAITSRPASWYPMLEYCDSEPGVDPSSERARGRQVGRAMLFPSQRILEREHLGRRRLPWKAALVREQPGDGAHLAVDAGIGGRPAREMHADRIIQPEQPFVHHVKYGSTADRLGDRAQPEDGVLVEGFTGGVLTARAENSTSPPRSTESRRRTRSQTLDRR